MDRSFLNSAVRCAVWTVSAVAAGWLALGESAMTDAVSHIVVPEYRLSAVENGRIVKIAVVVGQRVKQGQLLARLDTSVLEREIAEAEAKLRETKSATKSNLVELETAGDQTERSFQSDIDSIAAQEENVREQQGRESNELRSLREESARLRNLVKQGLAKTDRADEIELRVRTLDAQAVQWPLRIQAIEERRRAAVQRLENWRNSHKVQTSKLTREAHAAPHEDRTALQLEAIRVLRTRLENAKLSAPSDGEVVSVLARPGDVARAGEPFLVMHAAGSTQLVAYVKEREGDWLKSGDRAILRRRTMNREEMESKVVRVAGQVSQLPMRFWITPTTPLWGREIVLEMPADQRELAAGEAFDTRFVSVAPNPKTVAER